MSDPLKVGIIGRDGKLGRAAAEWIRADSSLELAGAVGPGDDWLALNGATVCLDVTRAGLGASHAKRALGMGIRPVVGTSGVSQEEVAELDEYARGLGLGGAVIPNFSLGFLALCRAAVAAQGSFSSASIVEAHRAEKVDAPSGSAAYLAAQMGIADDSVSSLRLRGVTAVHELCLQAEDESLRIRHESIGLSSFRGGLIACLKFASEADGVAYGLGEVTGALAM